MTQESSQLVGITPTDVERATGVFQRMPSIPRLFREVFVTEKIDGTNASIYIDEYGVQAASRSRWITPEDDNFGFARWVYENNGALAATLGPGHHFGEWFGRGIQRGYDFDHKRFALFNVSRWYVEHNAWAFTADEIAKQLPILETLIPGLTVVPILGRGVFDTNEILAIGEQLKAKGSVAHAGFMRPEGIVVYHTKADALFKYTFDKNDGHKGVE